MYKVKRKYNQAHEDAIWTCTWAKDDTLITGSLDCSIKIWSNENDLVTLKQTCEGHRLGVISLDTNSDKSILISSSLDSQIIFWDIETGKQLRNYEGTPGEIWTISCSPDDKYVATGSSTGVVNIIDAEKATHSSRIEFDSKFTSCVCFSPDGTKLATGAVNGIVSICDLKSGSILPLDGHALPVRSVCFSPDSRLLASTCDDKLVKIYDVRDGKVVVSTLHGHCNSVFGADFSPSGDHLTTCSIDKTVKVWDIASKKCIESFQEHSNQIWAVRYNLNNILASVSEDGSFVLYDCSE